MSSKEPWFKAWSADVLTDAKMDAIPAEAEGLLWRMWCVCNIRGSIPSDHQEIARLTCRKLSYVSQYVSHCVSFFDLRDGNLFSTRMEIEKAKSEAARKSAQVRYNKATSLDTDVERTANRTAERTAQKAREPESQIREEDQSQSLSSGSFGLQPHNGNGNGHDAVDKQALQNVWEYYLAKTNHNPLTYSFTPQRKEVGFRRLKECQKKADGDIEAGRDLMKAAIDGLIHSEFHMGRNENNKKYNDWISHLFKSYERMEAWWNA